MHRVLAFALLFDFAGFLSAQSQHDPYLSQSGLQFPLTGTLDPSGLYSFIGEYQISMKDLHWYDAGWSMKYKIECVSFPFVPKDQVPVEGDRTMVMPDLESYSFNQADGSRCTGWSWYNNMPLTEPDEHNLMRVVEGDFGQNSNEPVMSRPTSLVSTHFVHNPLIFACNDGDYRQYLPHTILKHTIYAVTSTGELADSLSWVYDNTRGQMRYYPFAEWLQGSEDYWDVTFRPTLLTDPNGHTYAATSNANWYQENGLPDATVNYYPADAVTRPNPLPGVYPDPGNEASTTFAGSTSDDFTHPPPYALLEAPLLNAHGYAYAGYDVNGGVQEPLFDGSLAWNVPHDYVIDKPIDLRIINPAEKIIYNPSHVTIEMAAQYTGQPLVFPSGYTFKTVHGTHPSIADVLAADPDGLYPNPTLAPVHSGLTSTYVVRAGNTLVIEPCVTILDAEIIVESGATVTWYPASFSGNPFVWQPGSINDYQTTPTSKPCPWNCYTNSFYEAGDITISGTETWTTSSLPGDLDSDGHLRIRGTLRIPQDQRLIVEPGVHLQFGPSGKLIVERGGQLNADGATFTNACETMWEGIEVWGETNHAQYPFSGNTATGRAILESSTVENARGAVRVYKPGSEDHNGGVLWATDCNFFNNHMGVEIRATRFMNGGTERSNVCRVDGCLFETNAFLLDPAYGDGINRSAAAEHIRLVDVHNVQIKNNKFATAVPGHVFPPHLRSTGIMGFNASFLAKNNQFINLSEGVWAANFPIPFRSVRVRENAFYNTIHSVVLQGTYAAEVSRNEILVPRSDAWAYTEEDVERGSNMPVGVYLLGSTEYNVEENTITGSEVDGTSGAGHFSYGVVASESMYSDAGSDPFPGVPDTDDIEVDNRRSTASLFYNRITGFSIAMQLEGDNKGAYQANDPALDGFGLVVECNDLANGFENWWLDMAVVGNFIDINNTYFGLLRDQGNCDAQNLQAANTFSPCWDSPFYPEHLYFDQNTQFADFKYADQQSKLPVSTCTNVDPVLNLHACAFGLGPRLCESTLDCDAICLHDKRIELSTNIKAVDSLLAQASESADIEVLQRKRAYLHAQQRLVHGAEVRYYLEAENMDSLLKVITNEPGTSKLRELLYYYISNGHYTAADSVLVLIMAEEGGAPSAHTELVMLQLSLMNAQQSASELSPAHRALLQAMVAQDPLGASSAKALLSLAFGDRFKRIPWAIDDRKPGRALWHTASNALPVPLKLWPVPASEVLNLESTEAVGSITLLDATGRVCARWAGQAAGLVQLDLQGLPAGVYVLRVDLADRTERRSFTKGN